ncbi:cupin domain-containing protein [Chloroflexota bacterium]
MNIWEVEPGSSRPPESHGREHGILVLSGKGLFLSGEKQFQITKDTVVFVGANEDHSFVNTGNELLRYVLFSQAGPLR